MNKNGVPCRKLRPPEGICDPQKLGGPDKLRPSKENRGQLKETVTP